MKLAKIIIGLINVISKTVFDFLNSIDNKEEKL